MIFYELELQKSSNSVIRKFSRLLNSMWKNSYNQNYSQELVTLIIKRNANFKIGIQQDAQEFLMWLLNSLKGNS